MRWHSIQRGFRGRERARGLRRGRAGGRRRSALSPSIYHHQLSNPELSLASQLTNFHRRSGMSPRRAVHLSRHEWPLSTREQGGIPFGIKDSVSMPSCSQVDMPDLRCTSVNCAAGVSSGSQCFLPEKPDRSRWTALDETGEPG